MDHAWKLEGELRKNGGIALRAVSTIDGKEVRTLKYGANTTGRAEISRIVEDVLKHAADLEKKNRSR